LSEDLGSVSVLSPGSKYDSGGKLLIKGNKLIFKVGVLQRIFMSKGFKIERNEITGWWIEEKEVGGDPPVRLMIANSMNIQGWSPSQVNVLTLNLRTMKGLYQITFLKVPWGEEPEEREKKLVKWLKDL